MWLAHFLTELVLPAGASAFGPAPAPGCLSVVLSLHGSVQGGPAELSSGALGQLANAAAPFLWNARPSVLYGSSGVLPPAPAPRVTSGLQRASSC